MSEVTNILYPDEATNAKILERIRNGEVGETRALPGARTECVCRNWCRGSLLPLTDHHPDCGHFSDSLVDVFKVELEGAWYVTTSREAAEADGENGATVTEWKMHREVMESLPEFQGF